MADEIISTEAGASSTPAPAEPVVNADTSTEKAPETVVETPNPLNDDPWENLGKDIVEDEVIKTETVDDKAAAAKAETDKSETKTEDKKAEATDKSDVDKVLEEVFADDADKPGESEKDEDIENMSPQEVIDRQRNATAKAAAARNLKKAEIVKDFQFPNKETGAFKPITEVAQRFAELNPTRYNELSQHAAHKLVDANPDATFKRAYAVKMLSINPSWDPSTATFPTLDELIAGHANGNGNGHAADTAAKPELSGEITNIIAELDKDADIDWDWRDPANDDKFTDDRERTLVKGLRAAMATAETETAEKRELKEKIDKLEKAVEGINAAKVDTAKTDIETTMQATITEYRAGVEKKILPYIRKNTGLEISENDTAEIKAFKESQMELYAGTAYEKANGLDSAFESFAYNQSSVKNELAEVTGRIVDAQLKESQAKLAKNAAQAAIHHEEAKEEMIPLVQLFAAANKEFKAKHITPFMNLIGLSSEKLAAPILEASERQEIVSNGSGTGTENVAKPDRRTVNDVFDAVVANVEKEEQLRSAA